MYDSIKRCFKKADIEDCDEPSGVLGWYQQRV